MTKIKICGLFRSDDIAYVNHARPDYIGFIIDFPKSHRSVSKKEVKTLRSTLHKDIKVVGVFVNKELDFIKEIVDEGIIDIVQLHGSEDELYIQSLQRLLPYTELWKAFQIRSSKDISRAQKCTANRIVLDNGYGTGISFDWSLISTFQKPIILAGGLTPENIPEAIRLLHPWAIDISSGVEVDKIKNKEKILAAVASLKVR